MPICTNAHVYYTGYNDVCQVFVSMLQLLTKFKIMKKMNKTEQIISLYPLISKLLTIEDLTILEIQKELKGRNNIDINYSTLRGIIAKIKTKNIYPKYNKIVPLFTTIDNESAIKHFSIKFKGTWICLKSSSPKKEFILTEKSLLKIPNPVGILYMKRFLNLFHISDTFLLDTFKTTYNMEILPYQLNEISNISSNIKTEYDKILSELKQKNLDYYFGVFKNA